MEDRLMEKTKRKFSALKITIVAVLCAASIFLVCLFDYHQKDDCTNNCESYLYARSITENELRSKLNELYKKYPNLSGCTLFNTREAIIKYAMEHQVQSDTD